MPRLFLLFFCLPACHLADSGSIDRTCEDLVLGCPEGISDDSGTEGPTDLDDDGYAADVDCNDQDPEVHPDADEICDEVDNDCDDAIDEEDDSLTDGLVRYSDGDGDGFGDPATSQQICEESSALVENDEDCDDEDPRIYPGADELCDGVDSDCDGSADADLVTVEGTNFDSIGDAIDAAPDGATIFICDGVYTESLRIGSSLNLTSIGGAESTIIVAEQGQPVIEIESGSVQIQGLGLEGGTGGSWNNAYTAGGGIFLTAGDLWLSESILTGNSAQLGGAIFADQNVESLKIEDTLIDGNHADEYCGAIFAYFPPVLITESTISNNSSSIWCGGVGGFGAEIEVSGGSIQDNAASSQGGGLWLSSSSLTLSGVEVSDNFSASHGGGIYVDSGTISCEGATSIVENASSGLGGGIYLQSSSIQGCSIEANAAENGGGVAVENGESQISDTEIEGNDAISGGGGLYLDGASLVLDNVELDSNIAVSPGSGGGGLFVDGSGEVTMLGGSVAGNVADEEGGGLLLVSGTVTAVSTNFGSGTSDNSPDDIALSGSTEPYMGLGAGTSFTCSSVDGALSCDL